jgi:hypothetical protein
VACHCWLPHFACSTFGLGADQMFVSPLSLSLLAWLTHLNFTSATSPHFIRKQNGPRVGNLPCGDGLCWLLACQSSTRHFPCSTKFTLCSTVCVAPQTSILRARYIIARGDRGGVVTGAELGPAMRTLRQTKTSRMVNSKTRSAKPAPIKATPPPLPSVLCQ